MILIFLGSWRSTLIVAIVDSAVDSHVADHSSGSLGYTINIMTLGGLALAVGILVDDATVEIENIHRNLALGKPITRAILDGAQQIAVPAFVSTLSICIVFVPVVFLEGVGAISFHAAGGGGGLRDAGFVLFSRTLVPTMAQYLLSQRSRTLHRRRRAGRWNPFSLRPRRVQPALRTNARTHIARPCVGAASIAGCC